MKTFLLSVMFYIISIAFPSSWIAFPLVFITFSLVIDTRDSFFYSAEFPLHDAVIQEDVEGVKRLLNKSSPFLVDKKDIQKNTALNYAVLLKHSERFIPGQVVDQAKQIKIVKLLLAHGASMDVEDSKARTVVNNAVLAGDVKIVKALVDAGAKVRGTFKNIINSLRLLQNSKEYSDAKAIAQLLIRRGANTFENGIDLLNYLHSPTQEEMKVFRKNYYEETEKFLKTAYHANSLKDDSDRNLLLCVELQTISRFYALKHMLIRLESKLWEFVNQNYTQYLEKECALFNAQTGLKSLGMNNIRRLSYSSDPQQTLKRWFGIHWLDNKPTEQLGITSTETVDALCKKFPPELLEEIRWLRWQDLAKRVIREDVNCQLISDYCIERLVDQCLSTRDFRLLEKLLLVDVSNDVTETLETAPRFV